MSFASMGAKALKEMFKGTAKLPVDVVKKVSTPVKVMRVPEEPLSLVQRPTK